MVNFLLQQGASVNTKTKVVFDFEIWIMKIQLTFWNATNITVMVKKNVDWTFSSLIWLMVFIYLFLQNGYTPLHQAAQQGNTHIVNVLLEHGAKPNTTTMVIQKIHILTSIYSCKVNWFSFCLCLSNAFPSVRMGTLLCQLPSASATSQWWTLWKLSLKRSSPLRRWALDICTFCF